jgi:hypothetical protein
MRLQSPIPPRIREFCQICSAFPALTRRMVPMNRKRVKKSTIDTGLAAFFDSRQHFLAANFKGHWIGTVFAPRKQRFSGLTDYLASLGRRENGAMGIKPREWNSAARGCWRCFFRRDSKFEKSCFLVIWHRRSGQAGCWNRQDLCQWRYFNVEKLQDIWRVSIK